MLIVLSISSIGYAIYQDSVEDGIVYYQNDVYIVTPSVLAITFV